MGGVEVIEKIIEVLEKDLRDRQGMWEGIAPDVEEELRDEWRTLLGKVMGEVGGVERAEVNNYISYLETVWGNIYKQTDGQVSTWMTETATTLVIAQQLSRIADALEKLVEVRKEERLP